MFLIMFSVLCLDLASSPTCTVVSVSPASNFERSSGRKFDYENDSQKPFTCSHNIVEM